ncbi:YesL family protein [Pseudalkalibacillus sp. R45]|uniref:YesL family protein n=1 Tax=Pseudalkalibacillus sp. R45 TaxID=3457433 RepID=UPI003FCDAC2A
MKIYDSKLFNIGSKIADYIILNFLWIMMCAPIITIFPATAAMCGVVRRWNRNEEPPIFKSFFTFFKENFKQSFILGVLWSIFIIGLYLNNLLFKDDVLVNIILLFAALIIGMITIYLFPVMVNFNVGIGKLIRNSFFLALLSPLNLILSFLVVISSMLIYYYLPITLIFTGSFTMYLIYSICQRTFDKALLIREQSNIIS